MGNNLTGAKAAFLTAFVRELRDHSGAMCEALTEELETHLSEHSGLVVVGLFRTGGVTDGVPDAMLRLQNCYSALRKSHLLNALSRVVTPPLIMHMDRVKRGEPKGKGKGKGAEVGKGGRGKGRGKNQGRGAPKRAAAP